MAGQERVPNKERRRLAREERKRAEQEAAKRERFGRVRSVALSVLVVAIIGGMSALAFLGGPEGIGETIVLARSEVESAREQAGCEVISDRPVDAPASHFEAASAPPADQMYSDPRPMNSGPHFAQTLPIIRSGSDNQLEERALGHNLEHGAVVAWYDPDQVDADTIGEMEDWSARLIESGFTEPRAGVGIFVSPYTEPGITSGKAVAYRAWGYSLDCDEWDETVANSVVLERFGNRGIAPEGRMAPFPSDQMRYEDDDAPAGEASQSPAATPTDAGDTSPTENEAPSPAAATTP
ncbi:MAG: DUF3105 domain-containing protein [Actinobacteria bacterium]|nr:DUF3105 domain-containing protein [Actinomycetota bacterium]